VESYQAMHLRNLHRTSPTSTQHWALLHPTHCWTWIQIH